MDSAPRPIAGAPALSADPERGQDEWGARVPDRDGLEISVADPSLPSAEAIWSPILALRTFVEPLTSRASAALRNFHVSFHEQAETKDGEEGDGLPGPRELTVSTATTRTAVVAAVLEEQSDCERTPSRRQDRITTVAATAAAVNASEGTIMGSSCGLGEGTAGPRGVELAIFGHDREEERKEDEIERRDDR